MTDGDWAAEAYRQGRRRKGCGKRAASITVAVLVLLLARWPRGKP